MKALRIFMMVALLAMPLFASNAWADFYSFLYDVDNQRIGATSDDEAIIGFTIPPGANDTLKTLALKSFVERAFSVQVLRLWVDDDATAGPSSGDSNIDSYVLNGDPFETQDSIVFANIGHVIGTEDTIFYVTVDAYTDSVEANAYFYHEHGLEVVIEAGYIHLGLSSGQLNTNRVANPGYNAGTPPWFDEFTLIFDTEGPPFTIDWCFALDECKEDTIDQLDSLCIQADTTAFVDAGDVILGFIELDLSPFCLSSTFKLSPLSDFGDDCFGGNGAVGWDSCFLIPDTRCGTCIDVDSGYVIYATASDSAGNETVAELYFDKPIDTCKPNIDSIHFFITYDQNDDGIAAIGDSLAIVAWGFSNPDFEVDSMRADLRAYFSTPSLAWRLLDDVTNNNRLFRLKFILTEELPVEMASDSSLNRITIWAFDNACNYDTAQQMLNARVDTRRPSFTECYYWYHWDANDTLDCIGIADSVKIGADLAGNTDLVSVTCDLVEAGIKGSSLQPLFDDGDLPVHGDATADDQEYNLLWEVGEPPIEDGKDTNNTSPPSIDYYYTALLTATDEAGNWDTCRTPRLNRILDTRRPRWSNQADVGFYIKQLPDAKLAIFWPTSDDTPSLSCNEKDAVFFFVYVDSGLGWETDPIGATFDTEYKSDTNMWKSEALSDGKYYKFKMVQEDDCNNTSDYSKILGAVADGTAPHVCIALPDSGLTFGVPFPLKAVADSASHDVDHSCLWYRFRRDLEDPLLPPGQWHLCGTCMSRPGGGYVFTDTVACVQYQGYRGWVEIITVSCDIVGNCQDTTMGWDDACLVEGDLFRQGRFLFYWDTLAPGVMVTEVSGSASPQTACGYDVERGEMNFVVIDVDGAEEGELFEVDVRAMGTSPMQDRIFHQDSCAMPCTVWFSVDGWPEGTQNLYIYVKDYDTGIEGNAQVQLCVPEAPPEHCIYINTPKEWMRIPCTGTSGYNCVQISALMYEYSQCSGITFTEVLFQWSPTGSDPWYKIDEVLGSSSWSTCWDNTGLVEDGDTVYFRAIAHDEHFLADTSFMVKVFVDCTQPDVTLRIEDVYYTCGDATPKVSCDPLTLKAIVGDTLVDLDRVRFFVKRHSDPDIHDYWVSINIGEPAWSDNIWMYYWEDPCCTIERAPGGAQNGACMWAGDYWDIRIAARDALGNYMFDYDNDGFFDDSTFNDAFATGAAFTVFVDDEAPQPAISLVCDQGHEPPICMVNPSSLLGGNDKAYVQAGNDITAEISVLPSEDTCEVMKVHWFLSVCDTCWRHVGTSDVPYNYPVTFNPLTDGLIPAYELEDGWWQGNLKAVLYDSLGNSTEDIISLYILDVTPSQALIVNPLNDSYVWGDVDLSILALNAYQIAKVCYEYSSDGETWLPVNEGYPNACVYQDCVEPSDTTFALVWHTLNTVDDGAYYVRAVATDCDNNVDDDPPTIRVTVANELPTAVLDDPRICERTCPDSPLDTLGYVAGTVTLYATATSDIPVDRTVFMYKSIFGYPDTYTVIGTDYFVSGGKYSVEWNTSSLDDGRYHVIARVYNAAGRYADSDPVTVTTDNSAPFAQIVSIMGDPHPDGMNITLGDVIDIELVAIDSTSDDGWTRCYNSGLVGIELCIEDCSGGTQYTKCFEVSPVYDGFHTVQWNTSGLEFDGCDGCYRFYVTVWDCLGNVTTSSKVTVYVSDVTAPITTIGGFDGNYIYGYSSLEKVSTLLFEYTVSGENSWIPIGWSEHLDCLYHDGALAISLFRTSWDPLALADGDYQVRVISHDECSNQDDDMAPVACFTKEGTTITLCDDGMGEMTFLKNWCVGEMHGLVQESSEMGTPVMFARYKNLGGHYSYEFIHMQGSDTEFAGSFYADSLNYGGDALFFSSVSIAVVPPPQTGEPSTVTYLQEGTFDIVKVKADLGTHGKYTGYNDIELEVQGGATDHDVYVWIAPTEMQWAPDHQADILPIGDNDGYATYISFTEHSACYDSCCAASTFFDGSGGLNMAPGDATHYDCCFLPGKFAKIKMYYSEEVDADKEHLAVAWWDCEDGDYKFDYISYHFAGAGFNTEEHSVVFGAECLKGPFVVVQRLERECDGTIVVDMLDIEPYCDGYTGPMPRFKTLITDNIQGTSGVNKSSIKFELKKPDQPYITIYNGDYSDSCDRWAKGFGQYNCGGYDEVSGIFGAGWNDSLYFQTFYYNEDQYPCPNCYLHHYTGNYNYYSCLPADPLPEGDSYFAKVSAENDNIQYCEQTWEFNVDATPPTVEFADSVGAYVGENPYFCITFGDAKAGVDKGSIWIDIYGDEGTSPDPNQHSFIGTLAPAQLNWIDDYTVCVDGTFEYYGGYLHIYVYGGPECECGGECNNPQYYDYTCGISDCVGNHTDVFWQYFSVDANAPSIYVGCDGDMIALGFADDQSGVAGWEVLEDGTPADEGAITLDPATGLWLYSPATGVDVVTVQAWDYVGNTDETTFNLPFDCAGPMVKFADDYVCKNPTIEFWVTDPAGVDWTTVNAYVTGCNEACYYYAPDLTDYIETGTGKVTLSGCHFDCTDGQEIEVYVFSGTSYTGDGPHDLNGKHGKYRRCSFVVDAVAPTISVSAYDKRPIRITIKDAKSGVDWESLEFYEDGDPITVDYNTETGVIVYDPESGGADIEVRVNDMTGCNLATKTFEVGYTSMDVLAFVNPHNFANPFDPRDGTRIVPDLSKDCNVTIKIYDFAGEFVKELQPSEWTHTGAQIFWDGTTEGGTTVANGTYLCYLYASCDGSTKTAVVKITVLKEDK